MRYASFAVGDITAIPEMKMARLAQKHADSYAPEVGVLGAGPTSDIKGNLFIDTYLELLGMADE